MFYYFRNTVCLGRVIYFVYQKYLLITHIPFPDYARIQFKLDYFPLIINIPVFFFNCCLRHLRKLELIVFVYFYFFPFSSSCFSSHISINMVTSLLA
jgi:phosphatidylserine synthase